MSDDSYCWQTARYINKFYQVLCLNSLILLKYSKNKLEVEYSSKKLTMVTSLCPQINISYFEAGFATRLPRPFVLTLGVLSYVGCSL